MRMPKTVTPYGFTLVELMVTVAVAAILMVLAAPSFIDFMDKSRLRGVADSVSDFINKARADSVKQGRDVNIAFRGTSTAWCVGANVAGEPTNPGEAIGTASACDCSTAPAACVVAGQQATLDSPALAGVSIDAIPGNFTFESRMGTVVPLGTSVATLTSPRGKFDLKLTVSPMGQVSFCVPASSKRAFSEFPSC
jgi:type IV fimbrial biogenesis protein FimT